MNFSTAYAFLKQGYKIRRPGWVGVLGIDKNNNPILEYSSFSISRNEFNIKTMEDMAATDWEVVNAEITGAEKLVIPFVKLRNPDACWTEPEEPFHAHHDDRGFDLTCVCCEIIAPGIYRYHSGLAFQFPDGYDAILRARSSVYKTGMILSNGTGTIDHGYIGEVQAVFYVICKPVTQIYTEGDRFAQLIIPGIDPRLVEFKEVEVLQATERGSGGYGSTGK